MQNFTTQRKLGEGSFSEVYLVTRKSDNQTYAMKKVKMHKLSSKEKENALNEIRILASINHTNVIGYKEAFFEDATSCLCIVMEYADGGDILGVINEKKRKRQQFTEKEIWSLFIQIVRGLKALHALQICHRDIKCANLFLTKEGEIKLGDLNVSKVAKKGLLRTQTGTPYYCSPEVWKDQPYDYKSDIWSLGCVLYEMITFLPPFRASTMKGLYTKVVAGKYDPIPSSYSRDLTDMLKACLIVKPQDRANCDQILNLPILKNHLDAKLKPEETLQSEQLLNTIRLPRQLNHIKNVIPAPNYESPQQKEAKKLQHLVQRSEQRLAEQQAQGSRGATPEETPRAKNLQDRALRKLNMAVIQEENEMGNTLGPNDVKVQISRDSALSNRQNRALSEQKPRAVPHTADLLERKREKLIQDVMKAEKPALHRDQSVQQVNRQLDDLQKKLALPPVQRSKGIYQSVDNLHAAPNSDRQYKRASEAYLQPAAGLNRDNSNHARYQQYQAPSVDDDSSKRLYRQPSHLRPPSGMNKQADDNESQGFCEMLRQHKESKQINFIRRNMISAQEPRRKYDDLIEKARCEEVMRLKNQNAIQRAIENDQVKYKVNAVRPPSGYQENQPPLSARHHQRPPRASDLNAYERQHNIIKEQALKDIHRLL